jgi:hypothetical protein
MLCFDFGLIFGPLLYYTQQPVTRLKKLKKTFRSIFCLAGGADWLRRLTALRASDTRLAPVLVPSGHRLAPTEPAGETRSGA